MIFPRPMPVSVTPEQLLKLQNDIDGYFIGGDRFTMWNQTNKVNYYTFDWLERAIGTVHCHVARNLKRKVKFGIYRFYCQVKPLGIGDVWPQLWGFKEGEKWPVISWLVAGIDGRLNVDRVAEAMAKNGGIMPRLGTDNGEALARLLKEMNAQVREATLEEAEGAFDRIDTALVKYGTTVDDLIKADGLIRKQGDY